MDSRIDTLNYFKSNTICVNINDTHSCITFAYAFPTFPVGCRRFYTSSGNALWVGQLQRGLSGRHVLVRRRELNGTRLRHTRLVFKFTKRHRRGGRTAPPDVSMFCTGRCLRTALRLAATSHRYVRSAAVGHVTLMLMEATVLRCVAIRRLGSPRAGSRRLLSYTFAM